MRLRQAIELCHILFCKALLATQDKSLIALKGGCNLRFFFGSIRYSEDLDFDVETIAEETLKRRVDKILDAQPFRSSLAAAKIEITTHSAPKQTETVQRWKVHLRAHGIDIPTKIEFSRRGVRRDSTLFEPIDPQLLAQHRMTPTFLTHYGISDAIQQKIEALAGRSETQARDIFDLAHLFSRNLVALPLASKALTGKAIECALSVDFDQFHGQVVEYLEDSAREYYAATAVWDKMQLQVISKLEELST